MGPKNYFMPDTEIAGRRVADAGRIPSNRGTIWGPKLRPERGPQKRSQMEPTSACNAGDLGPLLGRPMKV